MRDLWDNIKINIIHTIRVPERERSEKEEIENLFEEIIIANFPKLVKEKDTQVQEAQKVPNKVTPKKPTPRHIKIKIAKVKDKERILKAAKERQLPTREHP